MKTTIAENYAKLAIESVSELTEEVVFDLLKQAFIDGASADSQEELQLYDLDEDDLQFDDEFDDAIDGNELLNKLV